MTYQLIIAQAKNNLRRLERMLQNAIPANVYDFFKNIDNELKLVFIAIYVEYWHYDASLDEYSWDPFPMAGAKTPSYGFQHKVEEVIQHFARYVECGAWGSVTDSLDDFQVYFSEVIASLKPHEYSAMLVTACSLAEDFVDNVKYRYGKTTVILRGGPLQKPIGEFKNYVQKYADEYNAKAAVKTKKRFNGAIEKVIVFINCSDESTAETVFNVVLQEASKIEEFLPKLQPALGRTLRYAK